MELTKESLITIEGGKSRTSIYLLLAYAVGVIVTTIVGIVDGYLRPLPCNK